MTLTELRYIVAVAQERHFRRAADRCFVSQPTLSVAVKKLEEELGVTLFERGPNEVTATPVGKKIIAQAQRTLEDAESIKHIAQQGKDQLSGALRFGAIYTIGPYVIPELIPVVHEAAPNLQLIVEENYTAVLSEKLKCGELDAILISLPYEEPGVETLPLYREPFVVLLPTSHPLTQSKLIKPKQLNNEKTLLLGAGHCFRDQVLQSCPACAASTSATTTSDSILEGSSLETIRHMVATGMGITILPCTAAGADRYSQRLLAIRRFDKPSPYRDVALAWRTSFPRPNVIDVLSKSILNCKMSCIKPL